MLAHSKEKIESMYTCAPLRKLSDEEKAGLHYIGGYVLPKLHTKHAGKSSESEQAISILKARGRVLWEFLGGDVPLRPWNP